MITMLEIPGGYFKSALLSYRSPRTRAVSEINSGVVPQHPPITEAPFSTSTFI